MRWPSLTTVDDVVLAGRNWDAAGASRGVVVLVHGFSASKDDPAVVAVAEAVARTGFDVMGYDGRGHGESGGLCTLGDHERHDVAAAVAAARLRSERVVLVGASMGAIAVLRYAASHGDVTGVISVSSPARWRIPRTLRTLLAAGVTQTRPGRWLAARHLGVRLAQRWTRPLPPVTLAGAIRAPLAVIHGDADRFIPPGEASVLAAAAADPVRLTIVPGMGHAYDPAVIPAVVDAIEWIASLDPAAQGEPALT